MLSKLEDHTAGGLRMLSICTRSSTCVARLYEEVPIFSASVVLTQTRDCSPMVALVFREQVGAAWTTFSYFCRTSTSYLDTFTAFPFRTSTSFLCIATTFACQTSTFFVHIITTFACQTSTPFLHILPKFASRTFTSFLHRCYYICMLEIHFLPSHINYNSHVGHSLPSVTYLLHMHVGHALLSFTQLLHLQRSFLPSLHDANSLWKLD